MNSDNALAIYVKAPILGTVKTRLQPELKTKQSLQLYQAMTEDLIQNIADLAICDIYLLFTPQDAGQQIEQWLGTGFHYVAQHGDELGERMLNSFSYLHKMGYKKVVLIGSDIPTLDPITIINAYSSLDHCDVVIGPSFDGGYYLIGAKKPQPRLFTHMQWSTERVLLDTINRALEQNLDIIQLQYKSDIDRFEDVNDLWQHLKSDGNKKHLYASRTFAVLEAIFKTRQTSKSALDQ